MTVRPSLGTSLDLYRTRSGRENRKIKIKISKTKEAGDGPYFNSRGGVYGVHSTSGSQKTNEKLVHTSSNDGSIGSDLNDENIDCVYNIQVIQVYLKTRTESHSPDMSRHKPRRLPYSTRNFKIRLTSYMHLGYSASNLGFGILLVTCCVSSWPTV